MKNKIDISKWKEFNITDLFQVKLSGDDLQPGKLVDGDIPLVSSGKTNNGIVMYIEEQKDATLYNENTITIDMFGKAFYQSKRYYAVSHGRINILIPKFDITKNIGMFLVSVLEKSFEEKYSFTTMCSSTLLKNEKIKLPTDNNENPDWGYMEEYMENIKMQVNKSLNGLDYCIEENNKIDIIEWGEFEIGNLFEIVSPKVYHTREVKENLDGIPYVVRSKFNNGIKYMVERDEKFVVNPKGVISFGAENASFFYQEKEYISGRDMYYIDTRNLSRNTALFIIACLEKLTSKYSYNFGLFPKLLKEEKIKLPIKSNGEPDYEYMDKYMTELLKKAKNKLSCLNAI